MSSTNETPKRIKVQDSERRDFMISNIFKAVLEEAKSKERRDTVIHQIGTLVRAPEPINPARAELGHEYKQIPSGNGSRRAYQYRHLGI